MTDLIAELEDQARKLIFSAFTEDTALTLGQALVDMARAAGHPVVISIRGPNRVYFHAALPGSAPLNDLWAQRKSNTALMFHAASYLVGQRHLARGTSLAVHGLDPADYADHGGAVPIVVSGVGMVAVATVSGLPSADDHALVLRGIEQVLAQQSPAAGR